MWLGEGGGGCRMTQNLMTILRHLDARVKGRRGGGGGPERRLRSLQGPRSGDQKGETFTAYYPT